MKASLLASLVLFPATCPAEPVVSLAGVQVVHDDGGGDFGGFKTFNMGKGHNVALIVRSKGKTMVGFDEKKATVTLGGAKAECRFFGNMAFSDDRLAMKLEFHAKDRVRTGPDGGFPVKGDLPLVFATGREETCSEPFAVAVGEEVKFPAGGGDMPTLKVKSAGKAKSGDAEFEIEFSTTRKMDEFAGVVFHTKDGKPVKAERGGSSWTSFGGKGSGEVSYRFGKPQTELILAVEKWTGREEKTVKVDLKAGLVLP